MPKMNFSDEVEAWLKSSKPKTLGSFEEVFGGRTFAVLLLFLLFIPALPLPTGGLTHIFEIIAMLLSIEMIIGRTSIWLPKRWQKLKLSQAMLNKAIPMVVRRIRWFEKYSKPRLNGLLEKLFFRRVVGLIVLLLTVGAFLAPPFSGMDTLPSLGVVIISLSLILGDIFMFVAGSVVGAVGLGLVLFFGDVTVNIFKHFIK